MHSLEIPPPKPFSLWREPQHEFGNSKLYSQGSTHQQWGAAILSQGRNPFVIQELAELNSSLVLMWPDRCLIHYVIEEGFISAYSWTGFSPPWRGRPAGCRSHDIWGGCSHCIFPQSESWGLGRWDGCGPSMLSLFLSSLVQDPSTWIGTTQVQSMSSPLREAS